MLSSNDDSVNNIDIVPHDRCGIIKHLSKKHGLVPVYIISS